MRRLFVPFLLPSVLCFGAARSGAEIVEQVVAKVNGQIITLSEFESRQLEAARAARIAASDVGAYLRENNARILQQAIDDILLFQKAEDAGIQPPAQYIDEVIESLKKEHNITSQEQLEAELQREGMTLGQLRTSIERSVLQRIVVEREVEPKIAIAEAELAAEYERLRDSEFTTPATVTLQEILVTKDADGERLAAEIVTRARRGEDFQALAREHSTAPSRQNGGDLGEIAEVDMNPELRKVAQALPVGSVSDAIPGSAGHRIVKVVARTAGSTAPYDTVKAKLRERLMRSRFEKEYEAYLQALRKAAQVELRVREVPVQLTGPITEGSFLEGLEPGGGQEVGAAPTPGAPEEEAPGLPGAAADEISVTPQAAPKRVSPPDAPPPSPAELP